jgi:uncharacterized protein (DUF983 family)
MCCDNTSYEVVEINGECPACGEPTVDGNAFDRCNYSPEDCEVCGSARCDGSC